MRKLFAKSSEPPPKAWPKKKLQWWCLPYANVSDFKKKIREEGQIFLGQVYGASLLFTPDDAMPDSGVSPTPLSPWCWLDIPVCCLNWVLEFLDLFLLLRLFASAETGSCGCINPASARIRSTMGPNANWLSSRSWLRQGLCFIGKIQSYQCLPITDLIFSSAPLSHGFSPGLLRRIAKTLPCGACSGDEFGLVSGYVIVGSLAAAAESSGRGTWTASCHTLVRRDRFSMVLELSTRNWKELPVMPTVKSVNNAALWAC